MSDNTTALLAMKLPELKKLAAEAGVPGASTMRKGDIIAALSAATIPAASPTTRTVESSADSAPSAARQRRPPATPVASSPAIASRTRTAISRPAP